MCATYLGNLADLRTGRSQGNRMVSININKCCGSCSSFSLLNFPARAACKAGQSENFCASDGQNKRNPRPIRPVVHALWRCPCLRLLCFFYSFFRWNCAWLTRLWLVRVSAVTSSCCYCSWSWVRVGPRSHPFPPRPVTRFVSGLPL